MTLKEQILKILSEQKEGALEEKISESFKKSFPHFRLTDGSIKITKIDNDADVTTGSLKYVIVTLNINSFFVYKSKDDILALGEV